MNCDLKSATSLLSNFTKHVDQILAATGEPEEIKALKTDVFGRMTKAIDGQERYFRWGEHYLRSLLRAH